MQATTTTFLPGGMGRSWLENERAYSWLLWSSSSVTDMGPPGCSWGSLPAARARAGGESARGAGRPGHGTATGHHAPVIQGAVTDQRDAHHGAPSVPRARRIGQPRLGSWPA